MKLKGNIKEILGDLFLFFFVCALIAVGVYVGMWYVEKGESANTECLIRCRAAINFLCVLRCQ